MAFCKKAPGAYGFLKKKPQALGVKQPLAAPAANGCFVFSANERPY